MNNNILKVVGISILLVFTLVTPLTLGYNISISEKQIITEESNRPISYSNTFYVGGTGPNNYTKIQDAIDNATEGDIVHVYKSTYYENIKINKTINLIGENRDTTIIDGNYRKHTIHVTADNVFIKGFTIRRGYTDGIFLESSYGTIEGNNINSNKQAGINIWLHLRFYKNNITGNIISNNWHGIMINGAENNISANKISNNIFGISLSSYNNTITYNSILKNLIGIFVFYEVNNTILKNNIIYNILGAFFELYFNEDVNFTIKWEQNYWNRPRIIPKPIFGIKFTQDSVYPGFMYDKHPAKKPYII